MARDWERFWGYTRQKSVVTRFAGISFPFEIVFRVTAAIAFDVVSSVTARVYHHVVDDAAVMIPAQKTSIQPAVAIICAHLRGAVWIPEIHGAVLRPTQEAENAGKLSTFKTVKSYAGEGFAIFAPDSILLDKF